MDDSVEDLHWGRSTVDTVCPLDCPDACSLAVTVERGKLVSITGSQKQDVTDGYICSKVRRFGERVYGEARITEPLVRKGPRGKGEFETTSWDNALNTITRRMQEIRDTHGAEAILPFSYGGSNGLLSQGTTDAQLFRRFGTSRLARTVCSAPTKSAHQALYGKMPGITYRDYRHAKLIVIWGANSSSTNIHLMPHLKAAQEAGAALIVIDPRRTNLARRADIHLAVKPGTDVAVALAWHPERVDLTVRNGIRLSQMAGDAHANPPHVTGDDPSGPTAAQGQGPALGAPLGRLIAPPARQAFSAVVERPLFNASRRTPSAAPLSADGEPMLLGRYRLSGVVVMAERRLALLADASGQHFKVEEGGDLDGWRMLSISPQRLVLSRADERLEFALTPHPGD